MANSSHNLSFRSPEEEIRNCAALIISSIQSRENVAEALPELIESLKDWFNCEAITLFALDRPNRQLYSVNLVSENLPEIRLDISIKNIAGFVAATGKSLNIRDVNDPEELAQYHSQLTHGSAFDQTLDFQTRSMIVVPLPFNKKLIGILEIINKRNSEVFTDFDFRLAREMSPAMGHVLYNLVHSGAGENPYKNSEEMLEIKPEVKTERSLENRLHQISQAIHSAQNPDKIILELKDQILDLFDVEGITIYAVNPEENEIYSKIKTGETIDEIRVPISPHSIAGWSAMTHQSITVKDVYDKQELAAIHPDLCFDHTWDEKSHVKTRSVLAYPLIHDGKLMGLLQLINKRNEKIFGSGDENIAGIIAEVLALAFHNQEKFQKPKPTKFSYLIQNGLIGEHELTQAIIQARKNQVELETILLNNLGITKMELGKSLENFYQVPYFQPDPNLLIPREVLGGLNKNYLAKNFWVPIQNDSEKVVILINDPSNPDKLQNIKQIFPKKEIEFKVGLKVDILDLIKSRISQELTASSETEKEEMSHLILALEDGSEPDVNDSSEEDDANILSENDSAIVRLVNKILLDAYEQGASDIHIEPGIGKEKTVIRFRKDGECFNFETIPSFYKQAIVSRIKIMARLDIAEKRLPQDGKIKLRFGKKEIEYRVAICPTVGGNEDAVLRILAQGNALPLEKMNFTQRNLELIQRQIKKPYGLILVVGPTGSGKTTTLHSCLGTINTPRKKIWTAEDPVEITQKGLRQVQTLDKIGFNFARAMRSFLRGDPDVIMVGEMRDPETASIALEASLTGHLVFSTLHTNSAPETIVRLLEMGMNPLNFADGLLLILAQRLVKTLCKECKEEYHPDREEFDILVEQYGETSFRNLGIEYSDALTLHRPVGCSSCGNTGYAGRTALHELLEATPELKKMIMKKATVNELRTQAMEDGMTTLKQDGIQKVFQGDCDLKQVLSVCIL